MHQFISPSRRGLLIHYGISFFFRGLASLSALLMTWLVARALGAEESGYFLLSLSVITFLSVFSRAGLDNAVLRFTGAAQGVNEPGEVRSVLAKSMLVAGGLSLFVSIGLWFMSEWLAAEVFNKPAMVSTLRQMSPGILGLSLATLLAMSLQGLKKVVSSLLVLNILISLVLILGVITFTVDRSSDVAFYYSAATMITFVVGGCIWLANGLGSSAGRVSWAALGASCLPLWVSTLMAQLVLFSGQFFAGIWVESEEVAQLVVAQRCAVLMSFILMAFFNFVIAPQFAEFYRKGDMVGLRGSAVYSVRLMITFALPILVLIIFFPEFILGLFGSDFIEVAVYLQILALGQFVNVITGSVGYLLTMTGHEKDIRNNMLFCGPFAIMLSLALIPFWGAIGSAIATALALSVQNLIALWLVKKRLGFSLLSEAFLVMKMAKS